MPMKPVNRPLVERGTRERGKLFFSPNREPVHRLVPMTRKSFASGE